MNAVFKDLKTSKAFWVWRLDFILKCFQLSLWNKESTSTSKFDEVITREARFCSFCSLLNNACFATITPD